MHWAHRVRDRFPDGQLFVNLRGFDPTGTAMPTSEAIRRFLDALAVPDQRIPADPDSQVDLFRTLLADKRMLILLDNARDTDQVRPLVPGAPGCLVVVTSRNTLTGLVAADDAYPLSLFTIRPAGMIRLSTAMRRRWASLASCACIATWPNTSPTSVTSTMPPETRVRRTTPGSKPCRSSKRSTTRAPSFSETN